ncbi:MAG TPA: hypothetical protein VI542_05505 [Candidatus Tectomicrobia bacterium]
MMVYPAESPHNINNHGSQTARDLLTVVADAWLSFGAMFFQLSVGGPMLAQSPACPMGGRPVS